MVVYYVINLYYNKLLLTYNIIKLENRQVILTNLGGEVEET